MGPRVGLAIAAALLLTSCSDDPQGEPAPAPEETATELATLCTEVVNEAVVGTDLRSPDEVYVEVLGAFGSDAEPSPETRAGRGPSCATISTRQRPPAPRS